SATFTRQFSVSLPLTAPRPSTLPALSLHDALPIFLGRAGIREAYHTGRGSVVMRGRTHVEEIRKDREAIVITEIPYQVNKARMIDRKSTRLNSSHVKNSYAVFCLKKKT